MRKFDNSLLYVINYKYLIIKLKQIIFTIKMSKLINLKLHNISLYIIHSNKLIYNYFYKNKYFNAILLLLYLIINFTKDFNDKMEQYHNTHNLNNCPII
jgi:hypothetical protein